MKCLERADTRESAQPQTLVVVSTAGLCSFGGALRAVLIRPAKNLLMSIIAMIALYAPASSAQNWHWCNDLIPEPGSIKSYSEGGILDSAFGQNCNPYHQDDGIFYKYFATVAAWSSAVREYCDGSYWGNTVDWRSPYPNSINSEWLMDASFNGGPVFTSSAETIVLCAAGYFVALPQPPTLLPPPATILPDLGNSCSACKTGTPSVGHPIDPGSGNEFESHVDFADGGRGLEFIRSYNSGSVSSSALGFNWQHNYAAHISSLYNSLANPVAGMAYVSDVYDTAADACVSGWSTIAPAAAKAWPATAGAIASYDSATDTCNLSTGQTLAVYNPPIQHRPYCRPLTSPILTLR